MRCPYFLLVWIIGSQNITNATGVGETFGDLREQMTDCVRQDKLAAEQSETDSICPFTPPQKNQECKHLPDFFGST